MSLATNIPPPLESAPALLQIPLPKPKRMRIFYRLLLAWLILELGLRGIAIAIRLEPYRWFRPATEKQVILCVGDSWTEGTSAPGNRGYPQQLKEALAEKNLDCNVINRGSSGSNSNLILKNMDMALPKEHPDIVVIYAGNNDHWNFAGSTYWRMAGDRMGIWDRSKYWSLAMLHELKTFQLARVMVRQAVGDSGFNQAPSTEKEGSDPDRAPAGMNREILSESLEWNLREMISHCRAAGAAPILVTYFHHHGFGVNDSIRRVAATDGRVTLVDMNRIFHTDIKEEERAGFIIADDGHPNEKGYRLIAERVGREIELLTFVDRDTE